jgi:hypothetical protein
MVLHSRVQFGNLGINLSFIFVSIIEEGFFTRFCADMIMYKVSVDLLLVVNGQLIRPGVHRYVF